MWTIPLYRAVLARYPSVRITSNLRWRRRLFFGNGLRKPFDVSEGKEPSYRLVSRGVICSPAIVGTWSGRTGPSNPILA